jgi:ankyrin repeat protein
VVVSLSKFVRPFDKDAFSRDDAAMAIKLFSLIDAIINNALATVDAEIASGADVNAFPASGHQPPLHVAIEHQRIDIVRRLIDAGAR